MKILPRLAAALAGLGIASAAQAEGAAQSYGVYTSNTPVPTMIGTAWSDNEMLRTFKGQPYVMDYNRTGLTDNALFLYTTPDCSGAKYSWYAGDDIAAPPVARYDATTRQVWGSTPLSLQYIFVQCYRYQGQTYTYQQWQQWAAAPLLLDSSGVEYSWVAPFKVAPNLGAAMQIK
jgi:hypothetical protein